MIRKCLAGVLACLSFGAVHAATDAPSGYTKCAKEPETCSFSGTRQIAYGASGQFVYKTFTNSVACTLANFGSDPYPGKSKYCSYAGTTSGSSSSVASSAASSVSSSKASSSSSRASSASSSSASVVWSSSDRWGTWVNGGYTLYNNVWGAGYGPQTISANSYSKWTVWSNQPATGGIKSYPNVTRYIGRKISALNTLSTSFNVSTPSGTGAWESTYDIWDVDNKYEIMLWMNYTGKPDGSGNVKPIAAKYDAYGKAVPEYTNVSIGGSTWNVFKGSNGSNAVFSFLRTSNTNSATVDARAILKWIRTKGWMGDVTLGNFQYGFEITSSSGGMNFTVNSYSVTFN
jgi:hypothetical protein